MKTILLFSFALFFSVLPCLMGLSKCSDYSTPQEVVLAYKRGATDLDRDGDCFACESTFNVYVCGEKSYSKMLSDEQKKFGDDLQDPNQIVILDYSDVTVKGNAFAIGWKAINKKYPSIVIDKGYHYFNCNNLKGYMKFDDETIPHPFNKKTWNKDYVRQMCIKHGFKTGEY